MNTAVFLLAGRGSRLNRYTEIIPKCLVEVCGVPILHRMLDKLVSLGIKKTIFVVGYKWDYIEKSIGNSWKGIEIEYVNNTDWDKTNNIVSFYMAKDLIKDDFLLLEGDIIIEDNALDYFIAGKNQMAVSQFKPFMDGTVVTVDNNNIIDQIYLKKDISKSLNLSNTYKTVNIYSINKNDFHNYIVPELEKIIKHGEVNSYYEQAFAFLVNNKIIEFESVNYSDIKWYEVDNEKDLEIAESLFS